MSARPGADVPYPKATEARKPDTPGRARYKPSNHCAGNVGCPPLNLYARVRFLFPFCTRDRGCSAHPAFPAPSDFKARNVWANLGRIEPRECETAFEWSLVIASAAKQSILSLRGEMDCLCARQSWRGPAGERPVRVGRSGRPVASVAWSPATAGAKRTQRLCGVCY